MSVKLKDFITAIRRCKTPAEEGALVAKECASIRTAFKDESGSYRHRNVAKLLFISMLGYPVQFGQLECLKLIASTSFPEKRFGYTALPILLDPGSDVLMLATNSIKNDLSNGYVVSAALCALGNVAGSDMMEALTREIEDILAGTNPTLKKRALLLSAKIVRTIPDTSHKFVSRIPTFLGDRNHAVVLSATTLMYSVLQNVDSPHLEELLTNVPLVVRTNSASVLICLQCRYLRDLIAGSPSLAGAARANFDSQNSIKGSPGGTYGYRPGVSASVEYDFNGVNDPLLQAAFLSFLIGFVKKCPQEALKDTNFLPLRETIQLLLLPSETYRNSALTVVYEACRLALELSYQASAVHYGEGHERKVSLCAEMQQQALDWLDFFLSQKDNTLRYVAISVLANVAVNHSSAVKKYGSTVVDCLKDSDVSIQKKAVNLAYALTDSSNAIEMTTELLNFLLVTTDPLPTVNIDQAPLGKDVSFADGSHIVVTAPQALSNSSAQLESKNELTKLVIDKIGLAIDNYAPSKAWQIDSLIRLCCLAGNLIGPEAKTSILYTLLATPELHRVVMTKLASAVKENMYQIALAEISVRVFGELLGGRGDTFINIPSSESNTTEPRTNPLLTNDLLSVDVESTDDISAGVPLAPTSDKTTPLGSPAYQLLDNGLESDDTFGPQKADADISVDLVVDLLEIIMNIYGLGITRSTISPSEFIQPLSGLLQNQDISGVHGPISSGLIKSSPSPSVHIIKPYSFNQLPQACLPNAAVNALKSSRLLEALATTFVRIAAKFSRIRPRVLTLLGALRNKCLDFEAQQQIMEYELLLSPEIFLSGGQEILRNGALLKPHKGRRPNIRDVPIGPTDIMALEWPNRDQLIKSERPADKDVTKASFFISDEQLLIEDVPSSPSPVKQSLHKDVDLLDILFD